ncbi:MAG: CpaD family pilus assembly protein [Caulobacteraceae bacterium]
MKSRLPFLVLGLSALTACAGVPKPDVNRPLATSADRFEPAAEQTVRRIEIPVAPGQAELGNADRAELRSFAGEYLRYGHGPLVLETPSGAANSEAASMLAADARRTLANAGVSYAAIAGGTRETDGETQPILVSFSRYEALAPECAPLWEQDLGHQSNNQPWASFGCATNFNLAAMVEDPADLDHPRDEEPRDSGRRDTVMEAYREGEQTHAERSNDERVTISNAVQ